MTQQNQKNPTIIKTLDIHVACAKVKKECAHRVNTGEWSVKREQKNPSCYRR